MITVIIYDPIEGKKTYTLPSEEDIVFEIREGKLTVRERRYSFSAIRKALKKILG